MGATDFGKPIYDVIGQMLVGEPGDTVIVNFDGSVQSSELAGGQLYRFDAEETCHVKFGANPTATTSDTRVVADRLDYFTPISDSKVAAIKNSTAGKLRITPMNRG